MASSRSGGTCFRMSWTRRSASLRRISQDEHALESVGRVRLRRAAPRLAQKTRKIFLFPTSGTFVEAKFAFAAIEFFGMHTAPPITARLVGHDRMQHFVIQDVLEEPKRHEALIEPGIDTNDAIFFLDGPENKIFFRTFSVFAVPNQFVTAKTVTEMTRVQFVEETAQIEITAFGVEPELLLERQS